MIVLMVNLLDVMPGMDPVLGVDVTFLPKTNGMDQHLFSSSNISLRQKMVVFFLLIFRTSTMNFTNFPSSYGSKKMKKDESTQKMLAGSYSFRVDDLEVFCVS